MHACVDDYRTLLEAVIGNYQQLEFLQLTILALVPNVPQRAVYQIYLELMRLKELKTFILYTDDSTFFREKCFDSFATLSKGNEDRLS